MSAPGRSPKASKGRKRLFLSREGRKSRMLLQIHDELLFEVPEGEVEALRELVHKEMEQVTDLEVPLVAEIGIGKSWYDAENGK